MTASKPVPQYMAKNYLPIEVEVHQLHIFWNFHLNSSMWTRLMSNMHQHKKQRMKQCTNISKRNREWNKYKVSVDTYINHHYYYCGGNADHPI